MYTMWKYTEKCGKLLKKSFILLNNFICNLWGKSCSLLRYYRGISPHRPRKSQKISARVWNRSLEYESGESRQVYLLT